ncbi:MAG: 16S rRNA (guanine(966)-N(2))-methyltransferase RsmD [Myxococcales bacterium]|nr:16S rRNA (guanine(966)-N(2))-methyltransferase RsmD [Myxococcales bacterium]
MRIVGGSLRGRRIETPDSCQVRPTSDRVREGLSSALQARNLIAGTHVLDLFAGTGAFSFEMLSRGASHATLVDNDPRVIASIHQNALLLGLSTRITTERYDLAESLTPLFKRNRWPSHGFDLAFLDPPYAKIGLVGPLLKELLTHACLSTTATLVVEHATPHPPNLPSSFTAVKTYHYGSTSVVIGTSATTTHGI